jgi:hypothetical protein
MICTSMVLGCTSQGNKRRGRGGVFWPEEPARRMMTNVKVARMGRVIRLADLLARTHSPTEVEAGAVAVAEQAAGKEAVTRTATMQSGGCGVVV